MKQYSIKVRKNNSRINPNNVNGRVYIGKQKVMTQKKR